MPARRIHIDQFSADVQYSLSKVALHHAIIQEGNARLTRGLAAGLEKGKFTEILLFSSRRRTDADVAELQRRCRLDYPVTGKLNFTLEATGTEGNPQGKGTILADCGGSLWASRQIGSADLAFTNHEIQFGHMRLQAARGHCRHCCLQFQY